MKTVGSASAVASGVGYRLLGRYWLQVVMNDSLDAVQITQRRTARWTGRVLFQPRAQT